MATVYAVANQKGGVGKTTTAVNMAACVAEAGYRTLLVDLDPQCNATVALGLPRDLEPNTYTCLLGEADDRGTRRVRRVANLSVVPSTPDLAGATVELPRIGLGAAAAARRSRRCASASTRSCSTARRRWGRCRSTRWSPPTG